MSRVTNGNRHNGYGARVSSGARTIGQAMELTKQRLKHQGPAAAFDTTPQTKQWICPCRAVNPATRTRCRFAERKVRTGDA